MIVWYSTVYYIALYFGDFALSESVTQRTIHCHRESRPPQILLRGQTAASKKNSYWVPRPSSSRGFRVGYLPSTLNPLELFGDFEGDFEVKGLSG